MSHKFKTSTLVCIGDSLTDNGYWGKMMGSVPYENHWTYILERQTGITLINKGIGGDTTPEMLARFDRDVIANEPQYCTIWGGVNDIYIHQTPVETIVENIKAMTEKALIHGIQPILVTSPVGYFNPDREENEIKQLDDLRNAIVAYAEKNNLFLVDLCATPIYTDPSYRIEDHIHFRANAMMLIAEVFNDYLDKIMPVF